MRLLDKPFSHSFHHLAKPVKVQQTECRVTGQVYDDQPHGQVSEFATSHAPNSRSTRVPLTLAVLQHSSHGAGRRPSQGSVDVRVDENGLVCAPYYAAAKESDEQRDAVVELNAGAGQAQLVAKPVDVQEGSREFVKNERKAVVISKGPLLHTRISSSPILLFPWPEVSGVRSSKIKEWNTYKANASHCQRANRVQQSAESRQRNVLGGYLQIPQEISCGKSLNHATCGRVSPQPAHPVHLLPFRVSEDDPEGGRVDEQSLDHGHPVDVPVQSRAPVEVVVHLGTYDLRQPG